MDVIQYKFSYFLNNTKTTSILHHAKCTKYTKFKKHPLQIHKDIGSPTYKEMYPKWYNVSHGTPFFLKTGKLGSPYIYEFAKDSNETWYIC